MPKKKNDITIHISAAEYLTYVASVGNSNDSFKMRYEDENIWLTQKMLATLYNVDVRTINDHAVRFRKWAGQIVKDYTIQGWTMDKERLKKGHMFTDGSLCHSV